MLVTASINEQLIVRIVKVIMIAVIIIIIIIIVIIIVVIFRAPARGRSSSDTLCARGTCRSRIMGIISPYGDLAIISPTRHSERKLYLLKDYLARGGEIPGFV